MTTKVLFVCLGNICRSPMGEGVFRYLVEAEGLADKIEVDSVGTGSWHVGERPHAGTRKVLAAHGIEYSGRARQISHQDMADSHSWIIVMDQSNLDELRRRFGQHANVHRLLDFAANSSQRDVPDPYYTGNFEIVYDLVLDGCKGLLQEVKKSLR